MGVCWALTPRQKNRIAVAIIFLISLSKSVIFFADIPVQLDLPPVPAALIEMMLEALILAAVGFLRQAANPTMREGREAGLAYYPAPLARG